jgi:hypothetical protein
LNVPSCPRVIDASISWMTILLFEPSNLENESFRKVIENKFLKWVEDNNVLNKEKLQKDITRIIESGGKANINELVDKGLIPYDNDIEVYSRSIVKNVIYCLGCYYQHTGSEEIKQKIQSKTNSQDDLIKRVANKVLGRPLTHQKEWEMGAYSKLFVSWMKKPNH